MFSSSTYLQNGDSDRIISGSNFHAFVKISEGCNQNCAFCAIPSFKGRLKSRSIKSVVDEVKKLVSKGFIAAVKSTPELYKGVNTFQGKLTNADVAKTLEKPYSELSMLIGF